MSLDYIAEALRSLAVPIGELNYDPKNARVHGKKNITAIKDSLSAFGQRIPIVVQKDGMIVRAGNGRLKAAREMGWSHIAAVVTDDANEMAAAFAVADNRTAELAKWDQGKLGEVVIDIRNAEIDIDTEALIAAISFSDNDLAKMVNIATHMRTEFTEDEAPDVPEVAVTKVGELWEIGSHRFICGDARDPAVVDRLFEGRELPRLMVTDPPYGVSYDAEWREGISSSGPVTNDDIVDWSDALKLFPGDVAYIWHAAWSVVESCKSINDIGFDVRSQIIWKKQSFALSRGAYHWQHEPCWYAVRKGKTAGWIGDRKQSTVMEVANAGFGAGTDEDTNTIHSTQKPIECMARFIRHHKGAVYDPFLGSGTTIVAAHYLDRACFGVEIEPRYCDVILGRLENMTGKKARLL